MFYAADILWLFVTKIIIILDNEYSALFHSGLSASEFPIHYPHTHFHIYHIVFTSALSCLLFKLALAGASVMAQRVQNLPAVQETQETWIQSLGQEDPLEEEMATRSSILARKIPWTEQPGGLQSMGL